MEDVHPLGGVGPHAHRAANQIGIPAAPATTLPDMTFTFLPVAPVQGQIMGGPNDPGGAIHLPAISLPLMPLPILMPDAVTDIAATRLDPVVAAALGTRPTGPFEPQIDPALLMLSNQLPTPRQSVTPMPPTSAATAEPPRPRPKGRAAVVGVSPVCQAGGSGSTDTAAVVPLQRKRTVNADALAADEAEHLGSTTGKRQRRPAARKLGIAP